MHGAPQNPAEHPLPQPLSLWHPHLAPICPPFFPPVDASPSAPCRQPWRRRAPAVRGEGAAAAFHLPLG